uniref:Uncharacterized protein n=1 Tax=Streptomyces sp. NBC_00049 TaxID=2903617 RepID=A0AAU2JMF6_9ACTN
MTRTATTKEHDVTPSRQKPPPSRRGPGKKLCYSAAGCGSLFLSLDLGLVSLALRAGTQRQRLVDTIRLLIIRCRIAQLRQQHNQRGGGR